MKIFNIVAISKIKKSLNEFAYFINRNILVNFNFVNKTRIKKNKKKVITILKSPHVNKNAQEQFEIKKFGLNFNIKTTRPFNFLMYLKKIKLYIFPAVTIKVGNLNPNNPQKITYKKKISLNNYVKLRSELTKRFIKRTGDIIRERKNFYFHNQQEITDKKKVNSYNHYARLNLIIARVKCRRIRLVLLGIKAIPMLKESLRMKAPRTYAILKTFDNLGQ